MFISAGTIATFFIWWFIIQALHSSKRHPNFAEELKYKEQVEKERKELDIKSPTTASYPHRSEAENYIRYQEKFGEE